MAAVRPATSAAHSAPAGVARLSTVTKTGRSDASHRRLVFGIVLLREHAQPNPRLPGWRLQGAAHGVSERPGRDPARPRRWRVTSSTSTMGMRADPGQRAAGGGLLGTTVRVPAFACSFPARQPVGQEQPVQRRIGNLRANNPALAKVPFLPEAKSLQAPGGWFVARIDVRFDAVELELREPEFQKRQQRFVHIPVTPGGIGQPVAYLGAPALPIDLEERAVPEKPPILPALDAEANILPRRHGLQVAFDKRVRCVDGWPGRGAPVAHDPWIGENFEERRGIRLTQRPQQQALRAERDLVEGRHVKGSRYADSRRSGPDGQLKLCFPSGSPPPSVTIANGYGRRPAARRPWPQSARARRRYFVVGIMNSAPARMPDGQRCVTAFCRV